MLLGLKFWCYAITESQVVLSDALESIANVVAPGFAFFIVRYSARPPDDSHPYGHGKSEFFSAAFEGGLIAFAAVFILIESVRAFILGAQPTEVSTGTWVVAGAGLVNLLLGLYVLSVGKRSGSEALVASGHHILSDVWTSAAATAGLILISLTGVTWMDAALGFAAGTYLAFTGSKIVRGSLGGLLDEEDEHKLKAFSAALNRVVRPGIVGVHWTRMMRAGNYHYIDAHVVVPEMWNVLYAHDETNAFERRVMDSYPYEGEIHFHIDPCRRRYCSQCDFLECPVRQASFVRRARYSAKRVVNVAVLPLGEAEGPEN